MVETALLEAETREPDAPPDVQVTEAPASRRFDLIEASAVERANRNGTVNGGTADAKRAADHCIRVVAIDRATYPHFAVDRDHRFIGMQADQRLNEFVACCAQLWARACRESARASKRAAA